MNNTTNGILLIDKPIDYTSRDVVNKVSKAIGIKKVGHTGTLDPLATGVLVLTIGRCTKLGDFLTCKYKEYVAEFELGYETDVLDVTGTKVKVCDKEVTLEKIKDVIKSFKGKYNQEVPAYSAVKVNGKKLYEYARSGIEITLPKREVDIKELEIIDINDKKIRIRVLVSKGTYIRSLIRDIGVKLGTYATMSSLIRTKQGNFKLEDCNKLEDILKGNFKIISPMEALKDIKSMRIDDNDSLFKKVDNGVKLQLNLNDEYVSFVKNNEVFAVYKKDGEYHRMYVKL